MYELRNSCVPSEWAPACWVRRLVKPLLVLRDEFQDIEKLSERAKEFSNQQRHASLLSRQTDAGRIGGRSCLKRESQRITLEQTKTGENREQSQSFSWHKKGLVHPNFEWRAQTMES